MDPFLVNLGEPGSSSFLRASVSLTLSDPVRAKTVSANDLERTRLRAAVLEVLAGQSSAQLGTPEGRAGLQQAVKQRATAILKDAVITDVLFTDFVVQY